MKIWGNLFVGSKVILSVLKMNKYVPSIESAKSSGDFEKEREYIDKATSEWVNGLIKTFNLTFDVKGRENIPEGPCVFIANHQGYCDIPLMLKAVEGKQLGFIARDGFKTVPILSTWINRTRSLFIPTGTDTRESLRIINEGTNLLKDGFSLMIFPEGKRSWSSEMNEFKPGSFKLATKAKVPIVPVAIEGTYKLYEEHEKLTPGQTAYVVIHPAIETKDLSRAELKELPDKVHAIIRDTVADICKS